MIDTTKLSNRAPTRGAAIGMGRGVHWEPPEKLNTPGRQWQDTPLPVLPFPPGGHPEHNLTGMRVCRFIVLGYGGTGSSGSGARWVVRCSCGKYAMQKAKWLKSETAKTRAMCPACDYLEEMKRGHFAPEGRRTAEGAPR